MSEPFAGSGGVDMMYTAEGQDADASEANPFLNYEGVEPDYFSTLSLPILRGRPISARDREDAPLVVVVNEAMARRTWPGEDPIGKRIKWGPVDADQPWRTVVGLAADARYRTLEEIAPSVYVPFEQGIPVYPAYLIA